MLLAACIAYGAVLTIGSGWLVLAPDRRVARFRRNRGRVRDRRRKEKYLAEQVQSANGRSRSREELQNGRYGPLTNWVPDGSRDVYINEAFGFEVLGKELRAAQLGYRFPKLPSQQQQMDPLMNIANVPPSDYGRQFGHWVSHAVSRPAKEAE